MSSTLSSSGVVTEGAWFFQHDNEPFMNTPPTETGALVYAIPEDGSFLGSDDAWSSPEYSSNYWPDFEPETIPFYPQSYTQLSNRLILPPTTTPTNTDSDQDYPIQIQVVSPAYQSQNQYPSYLSYPGNIYNQSKMIPYQEKGIYINIDQATQPRQVPYSEKRNSFLIDCKRRGLSYKEIKRLGGFKEAESTLRGRFRTLTKAREQRVRKPKWENCDVQLLCEAVMVYQDKISTPASQLAGPQPPKVSWKKVAQFIWAHGGSYQFGNATCKKKWCELHGISLSK